MKTNIYIFLPILSVLVTVVCICIVIACKKKNPDLAEDNDPYAVPFGFDSKINSAEYGTLTEKEYFSDTTGVTRKCYIYTPPGYDSGLTYPVMYLLHGIGGTHTEWLGGNPNEILSNLINTGNAKPMIADNGVQTTYYTIHGGHDFSVWRNGLYHFAKSIF